jgi:hypothetical protein
LLQAGAPASSADTLIQPFFTKPGPARSTANPGKLMTSLLQEQQALQRQLQEERAARTTGKASLLSGIPPNASTPFVPAGQSSLGALLSD